MEHKVAFVTGAARGLGKAMSEALLDRGVKVCIADVLEELGRSTAEELNSIHGDGSAIFVSCDVSNIEKFTEAWNTCEENLGTPDLLVNNAGIGDEQNWKKTLDINLGGVITGTLLALEKLAKKEDGTGIGGRVVNIASIAGIKALPFGPIYSATKSGIVGFSRAMGHPLHYSLSGVKVQCLCPSLVGTDFLKDAMKTAFSPGIAKVLDKAAESFTLIPISEIAAAFISLIEEGPNGGVMVVEADKKPFYVDAQI